MIEYECKNCNKKFNLKGDYQRHLNRKNPCQKSTKLVTKSIKLAPEAPINIINDTELLCTICNKVFTRSSSLKRHQDGRCKMTSNSLFDKIKELENEIISLKNKTTDISKNVTNNNTNNNTNNGVIQNNTNNITINQYGKEDLSHLTFNDFNGIFNKCNSCVPNLVDLIHFNKDKPENNNIYISNLKGPYAMIYDGHKWNVADKNTTVDDMYDDKCDILVSKYENLKDHLDEKTMNKFTKFLNKYEDEDTKKNITKNIKLMLYNNREIALKTQ